MSRDGANDVRTSAGRRETGREASGRPLIRDCHLFLVLLICLENQIANLFLRRRIDDRTQQSKASPLAVHGVLTRRERDVAAVARSTLPNRKANQLQAVQMAVVKMEFRFGEF